ncbi:MAG: UvrD-helicase domain-containing protein [Steroidobacteraceae bacterium]
MSDADLDTLARERAIRIDSSILLEAPAGSGKTTVLTQRLLALLADVDEPEQVLAITFTRKAAAEMRMRVLGALAGDIDPAHPQAAIMRSLVARVHERSRARGWQLEAQASRLRILTIDAFNFSLAAQRPLAAGAGPVPAIADRPDELYLRAARRALIDGETEPALRGALDLLFERLDNQWGRFEGLLAGMLARRAHWLPHVLGSSAGDLRARISAALTRIVADQLTHNVGALPAPWLADAARLPGVGALAADVATFESWQALADAMLTKAGTLRKKVTAQIGAAYRDASNKALLVELLERLAGISAAERLFAATRALPAPDLPPDDATAIDALAQVLTWAARHLQLEFAQAGRVDHVYIAGAARAALTEDGGASDLAIRTGVTLRHILVDEFQDTSIAQFGLLATLVQDWSPGDGRTLFIVGDPMQSIYQFREAEVGLFLRARDFGIGPVRLEALRLSRNFRSRPALVGFSNRVFAGVFPAHDDMREGAVRFTPSVAARIADGDAPCVSLLAIANGRAEDEAAAVVERVRALRAAGGEGRIAVLVLARSHAAPIRAQLAAAGFAVRGVDLVPLAETPIVRDLGSLLRALSHPGDRTAWLSVLRAPWCGLTLRSLGVLSRPDDPLLVAEAMQAPERLALLDADERSRLDRIRAALAPAVDAFGRTAPGAALESTWLQLGGADCYDADDLEAAHEFFAALGDAWARGEWRGSAGLEPLLADLYARSAGADPAAIEIMTIHRAKGLEFDHVILPGLARLPRRGEEPLLRWLDLPRIAGPSDLLLSPIVAQDERSAHRLGGWIKGLERQRERQEQLRLLYVAATRARESLHWIAAIAVKDASDPRPRSGSLLAAAWPALAAGVTWADADPGHATPGDAPIEAAVPVTPPLLRLPASWRAATVEDRVAASDITVARESGTAPEFSWVRETARHIGTVVHRALEQWGRGQPPTAQAIEAARPGHRALLARLGVPEGELAAAVDTVTRALLRTQADAHGQWLFAPGHRSAANEWALTGLVDGRLVNVKIDRSFVDGEGTRWVIDYKTGSHEGGSLEDFLRNEAERYRPQLERYAQLARSFGPEPVRAALYFPLLGTLRVVALREGAGDAVSTSPR